ncbi:unnamed protein product [Acanthoscelides obtectus]|uniref:Uncharacterized protein n=1 Tax=Acanthoscelides obtectus TaxID=200917 RepID=A0A9P0VRW7_ACAOB|nr:unnamed protein product [Acanthoscelides obtectus]CAK1683626.1 hypothetical protein AOBTE_LOCUS34364 [Acanthoscelides obtectus]
MAMATNFVTLGELWSSHVEMEEEDEAIFSRIKVLIETICQTAGETGR